MAYCPALFSIVESGIVPGVAGNWSAALVLPLIARSDNLALSLFFLTPYFVFATDVLCICHRCMFCLPPMCFVFATNLSKCLCVVAEIKRKLFIKAQEGLDYHLFSLASNFITTSETI